MTSYMFRLKTGVPGSISRPGAPTDVEPNVLNAGLNFPGYGLPGKLSSGAFVPITGSADVVYGFLERPYPISNNVNDPLGTSTPQTTGVVGVMRKGYMMVKNNAGTPARGGTVYVRYANAAGGTPIGGIEATFISGTNIAVAGAQFMGPADASGNVEISFGGANQ